MVVDVLRREQPRPSRARPFRARARRWSRGCVRTAPRSFRRPTSCGSLTDLGLRRLLEGDRGGVSRRTVVDRDAVAVSPPLPRRDAGDRSRRHRVEVVRELDELDLDVAVVDRWPGSPSTARRPRRGREAATDESRGRSREVGNACAPGPQVRAASSALSGASSRSGERASPRRS